jgi:hypothetical protein
LADPVQSFAGDSTARCVAVGRSYPFTDRDDPQRAPGLIRSGCSVSIPRYNSSVVEVRLAIFSKSRMY